MTSELIKRVAVIGGTHGNERTGVALIRKFERFPDLLKRDSLEVITLLANPRAIAENRRYIDRDLNRCFDAQELHDPSLSSYEEKRAKEIYALLCPRNYPPIDFIIDLHSTTTNMGKTLIPSHQNPLLLKLSAYLQQVDPELRTLFGLIDDSTRLRSLTSFGCTVEVGPIAQGVLDASILEKTESMVTAILDFLDAWNQDKILGFSSSQLRVYHTIKSINFPKNPAGEIEAMIHPKLKNYEPLNSGDSIFVDFDGREIIYREPTTVYPVFANEAAYQEKGIAMIFTEMREMSI